MKGFIGLWRENDEEKHWDTIGIGVKDFERYEDNFVNRREFDNLIRYEVHQSQIWLIFFVKS